MSQTTGSTSPSPHQLRAELEAMVLGDLLGPAGGEDEELTERTVRDRYLVGVLAPSRAAPVAARPPAEDDEDEDTPLIPDELSEGGSDTADDGTTDADIPVAQAHLPSSFGLTFCVDDGEPSIRVAASWGQYKREKRDDREDHRGNPLRVWKRYPRGGVIEVPLARRPDPADGPRPAVPRHHRPGPGPQAGRPLRRHALPRQRPGGGPPQGRVPRLPAEARRHRRRRPGDLLQAGRGRPERRPRRTPHGDALPPPRRVRRRPRRQRPRRGRRWLARHGVEDRDRGRAAARSPPHRPAHRGRRRREPRLRQARRAGPRHEGRWPRPTPRQLPAMLAPLVAAYRDWIDREEAKLDDPAEGLAHFGDAGRVAIDNCRLTLRADRGRAATAGRRPPGVRGVRLHEPGHVAPADALDLLRAGPPGRAARLREGDRPPRQPELAAVPDRLHPAQPAGRHPARPPRAGRRPRRPGRPALLPHRRRQDRGVPRPLRLHHGPAAVAGDGRRSGRRGGRGRPDAVHAPAADHPAVPAGHGPDLRLRVDPPQGPGARGRSLGQDAVPHRPLGRPPHHAQPHRRRRGGDQAGRVATSIGGGGRRHAVPAHHLPLVRQRHRGAASTSTPSRTPTARPARSPTAATSSASASSAAARPPTRACRSSWWTRRSTGGCRRC